MQTTQDATSLLDFRELLEHLPHADENALASEFITGRVPAFVRNSYGTLDEYELPMAYDAERDAWRIDRAGAREGRFLFRRCDVDAIASRHPEWLPTPEPYCNSDANPLAQALTCCDPDVQPIVQSLPIVMELEMERNRLKDSLKHAFEVIDSQRAKVAKMRSLEAENAALKQREEQGRQTVEAQRKVLDIQEATLAELGRRITELEAELSKAQSVACIGDGLPRIACDCLRQGLSREEAAAKLHECQYMPSYSVVRCLLATKSMLDEELSYRAPDRDGVNNRRTSAGKLMVTRGKEGK